MGEIVGAGPARPRPHHRAARGDPAGAQRGQGDHPRHRAAAAAQRGLRDARLRHRRRPGLALGHHRRVRRHRAGAPRRPVHLRGAAARDVPDAVRLPRRPRTGRNDREARATSTAPGSPRSTTTVPADLLRHHQPVEVPRRGAARQALGHHRRLPDRRHGGPPAPRPRARRRHRRHRRRVLLIASGALSHTFWPLRELRDHEASDPVHIFTPEARAADYERIAWFKDGRPRARSSTPWTSSAGTGRRRSSATT